MEISSPLTGYEPTSYPADVLRAAAEELVQALSDTGYIVTGSCVTAERENVASMSQRIEDGLRADGVIDYIIGPLILGNETLIGNTVGVWRQRPIEN